MARIRHDRQRPLAALITLSFALVSCSPTDRAGWTSTVGATDLLAVAEVGSATEAITVTVRLPERYLAAEEFVQRIELETDAGIVAATRTDLEEPLRLDLPESWSTSTASEGVLRVILGYCNEATKDVCHIDIAELDVRVVGDGEPRVGLLYAPPLPDL